MSKYTTEVRFICENAAGLTESEGYSSINKVIEDAIPSVFDFDFPIFDEAYRPILEKKILKHYYTREICCETVGLWKHYLDMKMNEIMPYYNQLYNSTLIEFNPMYDVDLTTDYQKVDNGNNARSRGVDESNTFGETEVLDEDKTHSETQVLDENKRNSNTNVIDENVRGSDTTTSETTGTNGSTTNNTNANKNDHWEYFSDTPEGGINGLDPTASALGQNNYLTTATHITDDGTGSTSSSTVSGNTHSSTGTTGSNTGERDVTTTDNGTNETDATTTINGTNSTDSTRNRTGNDNKKIKENSSEKLNNVEDYLQHVVGKRGGTSFSELLEQFRKTFLNIDMQIINELKPLFMNLW